MFTDDTCVDNELKINSDYAKNYEVRKRREELSKLQQKYGNDINSSDESSSSLESEDENAKALTPAIERDFFRTLSLLKGNDPKIYKKDTKFFVEPDVEEPAEKQVNEKSKPIYLKDYERNRLLTKGAEEHSSNSDDEDDSVRAKRSSSPTFVQEQAQLKEGFKEALENSDDDLLKIRKKTEEELEEEENEYVKWLKGQEINKKNKKVEEMETLQRYWTDPNLDKNEEFLRDYILRKGYINKDFATVPTYDQVVASDDDNSDADAIEKQEDFERRFNFRFEEPNSDLIVSYPRTVTESVRRKDERRKEKRQNRKLRKSEEKSKKVEELKRLKNLKRQEIIEKIAKLKEITGNDELCFEEFALDDEFDPTKYDNAMEKVFENYDEADEDEIKPYFSDSDLDCTKWDDYGILRNEPSVQNDEPHCEDPDFNMDADYEPKVKQSIDSKIKSKHAAVSTDSLQKGIDDYYKLHFEDVIGDVPFRFKYRKVLPNNFGLSASEILISEDTELNRWASLKNVIRYRTEEEEKKYKRKIDKKSTALKKKSRILTSMNDEKLLEGLKKAVNENNYSGNTMKSRKHRIKKEFLKKGSKGIKNIIKEQKSKRKANKPINISAQRLAAYGI